VPAQLKLLTRQVGTLLLQAFGHEVEGKSRAADAVVVLQAYLNPLRVMVGSLNEQAVTRDF
jgi:hypothetical protein